MSIHSVFVKIDTDAKEVVSEIRDFLDKLVSRFEATQAESTVRTQNGPASTVVHTPQPPAAK